MNRNTITFRKVGWRCFGLFWISFIAIFIGVWEISDGSFAYTKLPPFAQYAIIALIFLFSLACTFLIGTLFTLKGSKNDLFNIGKKAPAKIIRVYETGTIVNNLSVKGFELEVIPNNEPVFKTTTEQILSNLKIQNFEIGNDVLVAYHPVTRKTMIISDVVSILKF
jgi:hypothetical protein